MRPGSSFSAFTGTIGPAWYGIENVSSMSGAATFSSITFGSPSSNDFTDPSGNCSDQAPSFFTGFTGYHLGRQASSGGGVSEAAGAASGIARTSAGGTAREAIAPRRPLLW